MEEESEGSHGNQECTTSHVCTTAVPGAEGPAAAPSPAGSPGPPGPSTRVLPPAGAVGAVVIRSPGLRARRGWGRLGQQAGAKAAEQPGSIAGTGTGRLLPPSC